MIDFLLSKGARVQDRNKFGWTALMIATCNGHLNAVQTLLNNDAVFWSAQALENQVDVAGR